jgi:hypothetical protein
MRRTPRLLLGTTAAVLAVAACGAPSAMASHSTCAAMGGPANEALAESLILAEMKDEGTLHFGPKKVRIGGPDWAPIKVKVEAWVSNPRNLDITCATSTFKLKVDVKARVSGRAGSVTKKGDARIEGHIKVVLSTPPKVCPEDVKMPELNLQGINNKVDDWIRKKINQSGLVQVPCQQVG